jgi:hypothetical protein
MIQRESGRFFEKKGRARPPVRKKLLLQGGVVGATSHAPRSKSFFASFFSKKEVLS